MHPSITEVLLHMQMENSSTEYTNSPYSNSESSVITQLNNSCAFHLWIPFLTYHIQHIRYSLNYSLGTSL